MRYLNSFSTIIISYIILNILFFNRLHGQQFKNHINEDFNLEEQNSKTFFNGLIESYNDAKFKKDTVQAVRNLLYLSTYERNNLNYASAFNYSGEALFLAEEIKDTILMAKSHEALGILSYLFKQDSEAGLNFKMAHSYYKNLYKQSEIEIIDLYQSHYNLILYYQRIENTPTLRAHIDSSYSIATNAKVKNLYNVFLNEKKSSILEWNKQPIDALELLHDAAKNLETLKNNSEENKLNKSFLIIVYGRIGNIYMSQNKINLAKTFLKKSIDIRDVNGEHTFYKSFAHRQYSTLLFRDGDYKKAYDNLNISNAINDKYLNPRNDENQGFLTIKNRYKDQLNKKNELLSIQNLELSRKKQDALRFRILFFIALFVAIIVGLIMRHRFKSLKHKEKERDSNELLTIKNRELTANTLQLIEKEEVIKKLSSHIKTSNSDKQSQSLVKSIERSSVSLWDAFNSRFKEQNIGFYERLQRKIPDLSGSDLKLCALIKLNFSGKEMAYLLGISLGSVHVARHRLRKKIKLERHQNLTSFITSI